MLRAHTLREGVRDHLSALDRNMHTWCLTLSSTVHQKATCLLQAAQHWRDGSAGVRFLHGHTCAVEAVSVWGDTLASLSSAEVRMHVLTAGLSRRDLKWLHAALICVSKQRMLSAYFPACQRLHCVCAMALLTSMSSWHVASFENSS